MADLPFVKRQIIGFLSSRCTSLFMKVIKLGGSIITRKSGYRKARHQAIASLTKAIADVWKESAKDLVVVHGAGSFGHALVLEHKINDGIRTDEHRLGYADTHAACSELSLLVVKAFVEEGVPAISIPPSSIIKQKDKRISVFREAVVNEYLAEGYLPVLYGDMVPDSELGGSVCSGDQIMAWLGKDAESLIFVTMVDGVMDARRNLIPKITNDNFKEISKHFKESKNDVTGAMKGKIEELLGLGTTSYIVSGAHPERVKALLKGQDTLCTVVRG
jgi:isopentenyl phosphate kinase